MPIKRRTSSGDGEGGHSTALARRSGKKIIKSKKGGDTELPKKATGVKKRTLSSTAIGGEVGEVISLWNAQAPGTIRKLNDSPTYGRTKSGILTLDLCLAGGFKRSRAGMIYGEKSSGKTTTLTKIMKNALEKEPDGIAAFIDIEGTADKNWMATLGADTDRVIIIEPSTGEEAVDQADALLRSREVCFLGLDSIAMLTPFTEIDSSAEDQQIGLQARLIGKMLRRLNNALLQERRREHHPTCLLLNQFRMKAGLVFGDPRTLPGGKALEFVTSQQIETQNKEHKDSNNVVVYNEHIAKVTKDKTGGRYKEAKFKLIRDESTDFPVGWIDQGGSILEFGERAGLVRGKYEVDGIKTKFRKKDDFREFLLENPDKESEICDKIIHYYRKKWGIED